MADYQEAHHARNLRSDARFSSWTPLHNKQQNLQLFEERVTLVLHWFDLWTDRQRKHLLHRLLTRCTKSQLKHCRDLLIQTVPATRVDFTAVLPRFLSLYVLSFLSPRDLCRAAQVSWHWRVLAEQDCLWVSRCVRKGWFLPYAPGSKEFGAWKSHYVSCVSTLDWLTPREAAERYGTREQPDMEEEAERRKMRQIIRDKVRMEKMVSMRTRRAWGSYTRTDGVQGGVTSQTTPPCRPRTEGSSGVGLRLDRGHPLNKAQSLETIQSSSLNSERLAKARGILSSFTSCRAPSHTSSPPPPQLTASSLLLLVSNAIPAYEVLLSGVKADVTVVLYDHRGSLSALLAQVERAVGGRPVRRLGLLATGGTEDVSILHNCSLSDKSLLNPDRREFWEKLSGWVAPGQDGGGIDIFCPLAASASGVSVMNDLSILTGLEVRAPMGLATGSFQNILSEWSDSRAHAGLPAAPALRYLDESVLQAWCIQARWMVEALGQIKRSLGPQLQRAGVQARGRALGYFLWDKICLDKLLVSRDVGEALTEGLTALSRRDESRPLEFLSTFLIRWREESDAEENKWTNKEVDEASSRSTQPQTELDWRGTVVRELLHSERLYLERLGSVQKVYQERLTETLKSDRAILSFTEIQIVLVPVAQILELNRVFEADLRVRVHQWGAEQCVGDVFAKLCSRLRVYTNYLNNYPTALNTIDKCREAKPAFRAFLKTVDRTLATHMLSLQELLLSPVWRVDEYVTLLQALSLHTRPDHADHTDVRASLDTMLRFREFIRKLKWNSEADELMDETQQMIQGCPSLREGNRQLMTSQDAALLRSRDDNVPDSLRTFEHVSDVTLFLFNDALVLTLRNVRHTPFSLAHRSTHTFMASVALDSLAVRELTHTRYVSHAFVLDGPRRSWVCATGKGEEKEHFLCVLRAAVGAALRER